MTVSIFFDNVRVNLQPFFFELAELFLEDRRIFGVKLVVCRVSRHVSFGNSSMAANLGPPASSSVFEDAEQLEELYLWGK